MVRKNFNEDGNLITNPDARWVIGDSTRDEIRAIVTEAFEKEIPIDDVIEDIENAGSFSESRARMISVTEVSRAATTGNFEVWKQSGLVNKVQWLLSEDHDEGDEDDCMLNADAIVDL